MVTLEWGVKYSCKVQLHMYQRIQRTMEVCVYKGIFFITRKVAQLRYHLCPEKPLCYLAFIILGLLKSQFVNWQTSNLKNKNEATNQQHNKASVHCLKVMYMLQKPETVSLSATTSSYSVLWELLTQTQLGTDAEVSQRNNLSGRILARPFIPQRCLVLPFISF